MCSRPIVKLNDFCTASNYIHFVTSSPAPTTSSCFICFGHHRALIISTLWIYSLMLVATSTSPNHHNTTVTPEQNLSLCFSHYRDGMVIKQADKSADVVLWQADLCRNEVIRHSWKSVFHRPHHPPPLLPTLIS